MAYKFKKKQHNADTHYSQYEHLAMLEEPAGLSSESYRKIKVGLEYSEVDAKLQVLQVVSSLQGEGKTTTALNLACAYAEAGKNVVVVDLDFRRPKLHRTLRIENKNGITDVLAGNIELKDAIKSNREKIPFDIINRGTKTPFPTALLGSSELAAQFEKLRKMYDIIIVDCPPVLAVSDSFVISKLVDGALFVVSKEITEKGAAREAAKSLRANNVNVLGTIVTGITKKGNSYYGYKYQYYYQNYKDDAAK